jgi:hypothetical protein
MAMRRAAQVKSQVPKKKAEEKTHGKLDRNWGKTMVK